MADADFSNEYRQVFDKAQVSYISGDERYKFAPFKALIDASWQEVLRADRSNKDTRFYTRSSALTNIVNLFPEWSQAADGSEKDSFTFADLQMTAQYGTEANFVERYFRNTDVLNKFQKAGSVFLKGAEELPAQSNAWTPTAAYPTKEAFAKNLLNNYRTKYPEYTAKLVYLFQAGNLRDEVSPYSATLEILHQVSPVNASLSERGFYFSSAFLNQFNQIMNAFRIFRNMEWDKENKSDGKITSEEYARNFSTSSATQQHKLHIAGLQIQKYKSLVGLTGPRAGMSGVLDMKDAALSAHEKLRASHPYEMWQIDSMLFVFGVSINSSDPVSYIYCCMGVGKAIQAKTIPPRPE